MKSPHLTPFMSASPSFSTSPMYCKAGNSGVGWKFSRGTCAVKKKLNLKKRKIRTNLKITLEVALQIRPQTPASLKCSKTEMCCHKNWTELLHFQGWQIKGIWKIIQIYIKVIFLQFAPLIWNPKPDLFLQSVTTRGASTWFTAGACSLWLSWANPWGSLLTGRNKP